MTFRQFLVNYLSPWYFLLRCFWLFNAFVGWLLTTAILAGQGWNPNTAHNIGLVVGFILVWNALRPWKVGPSYNDIKNGLDNLNNRYK